MSRSDTTDELSDMVRRKLRNLTPYWASEVRVDGDFHDSGIVDFMAFRPSMGMEFAHTDGNVELGTFYFVEVKSCMADFTSGHGLNFRGDQNWLVCERKLAEELREKQLLPHNCTVFVPNKPRNRLISYIKTTPEMARRDHSAAFLLFQMMKRGAYDR